MKHRKDIDCSSLSDSELLSGIKKRDSAAFDALYMRYHASLYSFTMKLIKNSDDSSDIIQDTFIKLWEHAGMIPERLNMKSYLYSMTRNRVLNYIRDNRTRFLNNYNIVLQSEKEVENEAFKRAEDKNRTRLLDRAIEDLPPQQRKVAESRRKGYSNKEIAEMMHLSLNTVNIHYKLCLKAIKNKMQGNK